MASVAPDYERLSDLELARLFAGRDLHAIRLITRRNNQRLFRVAWGVLKDRAEAEEAVQDAYLKAFAAAPQFAGRSALSTWLTRIVLNEALERRRSAERRTRLLRNNSVTDMDEYREKLMQGSASSHSPEADTARKQLAKLLEAAIAELPEPFRLVFILREVEGLSIEQTSDALDIPRQTVKTRLLRARRRLQEALTPALKDVLQGAFPFAGADCDALTERVIAKLDLLPAAPPSATKDRD